jgi:hypothetical protein
MGRTLHHWTSNYSHMADVDSVVRVGSAHALLYYFGIRLPIIPGGHAERLSHCLLNRQKMYIVHLVQITSSHAFMTFGSRRRPKIKLRDHKTKSIKYGISTAKKKQALMTIEKHPLPNLSRVMRGEL